MWNLTFIAIGGAAGAVSRYLLSGWVNQAMNSTSGGNFPFGTLAVNVLGSLVIGAIIQLGQSSNSIPEHWRAGITVGFLGALTTFSTFSYETIVHMEQGEWRISLGNIVANVVLCVVAVWVGLSVVRSMIG